MAFVLWVSMHPSGNNHLTCGQNKPVLDEGKVCMNNSIYGRIATLWTVCTRASSLSKSVVGVVLGPYSCDLVELKYSRGENLTEKCSLWPREWWVHQILYCKALQRLYCRGGYSALNWGEVVVVDRLIAKLRVGTKGFFPWNLQLLRGLLAISPRCLVQCTARIWRTCFMHKTSTPYITWQSAGSLVLSPQKVLPCHQFY